MSRYNFHIYAFLLCDRWFSSKMSVIYIKGNRLKLCLRVYPTFFSYVRVIQNHPPTPVRNSKYLAIPPTHPFTLT